MEREVVITLIYKEGIYQSIKNFYIKELKIKEELTNF